MWTHFIHCSFVSIVDFEQVNAGWFVNHYLTSIIQKKAIHSEWLEMVFGVLQHATEKLVLYIYSQPENRYFLF